MAELLSLQLGVGWGYLSSITSRCTSQVLTAHPDTVMSGACRRKQMSTARTGVESKRGQAGVGERGRECSSVACSLSMHKALGSKPSTP